MKIYFDGCSMTKGFGYLGDNYEDVRWSKLLCNKLNAEEYNVSKSGGSNQRILRNLAREYFDEQFDMAVIQLTFISRTEYHDGSNFVPINSHVKREPDGSYKIENTTRNFIHEHKRWGGKRLKNGSYSPFWGNYYTNVYNDEFGNAMEETVYNSVKSICKAKNIPLVMLSCFKNTKLNYDIMITPDKYEAVSKNNPHPNAESQILIADDIYNFLYRSKHT